MTWLIMYAVAVTIYAANQKINNTYYIDSVDGHIDFLSMISNIDEDKAELTKYRLKRGLWSDFGL